MELYYNTGSRNPIRDHTTGILSDLLSEVIDRVRSKTGDDMLSVAESLNVNRHNPLLHSVPLRDGVKDVHAALQDHHLVSRKRKRTASPSKDSSSDGETDFVRENGAVTNGHPPLSDQTSTKPSQPKPAQTCTSISESSELSNQIKLPIEPPKPPKTRGKNSVRTSLRRAMLEAKKESTKPPPEPSTPAPPPAPASNTQPKPPDNKPKRKRKSVKDLHKKCTKRFISLVDTMLTDVPLILDPDEGELVSLLESKCPKNWAVGQKRTPAFRKKYFCRKCTLGE